MVIAAWVLLIFFGLMASLYLLTFIFGGEFGYPKMTMWVISIFITAISAGIIWGHLFQ